MLKGHFALLLVLPLAFGDSYVSLGALRTRSNALKARLGANRFVSLAHAHAGGPAEVDAAAAQHGSTCEEEFWEANPDYAIHNKHDFRSYDIDAEWRNISICEMNRERALVGSPPLAWDDALARTADKWATVLQMDGCHMEHSTHEWTMREYARQGGSEEPLGESLAWSCCDSPPKQGGDQVVDMWKTERENYNYGPVGSSCTSKERGEATGEYTQMVWSGTKKVGCGMASCGEKGTVWVCHFWPPGNVVGEVPFCEENMLGGMGRCPGSGGVQPHGCQGVVREAPESNANEAEGHGAAAEDGDGHDGGEPGDFLAPEGRDGEGGDEGEQMAQHVDAIVVVEGLAASQFDDIVFAGVVAESLSVPLYRVTVSLPGDGGHDDAAHHRRLLSSPTRLSVELTVWCGETGVCERLQSKLNGLECNGRLASALSAAFKATVRTPECPSTVYHPPAGMPGSVTFPDAFPNSVRHWLLIGFLGTGIGAAAAFYLALGSPRELTMPSVLASMVCAIAMVSYYCMWSGVGVTLKTAGSTPRVIFYTKYLDWAVSTPLLLTTLGSIGGADKPTIVAMVGNDVLMVTCGLIGTFLIAPYKYVWWFLGMVFFAIVLLLVLRVVQRGGNEGHLRTLGIILAVSWGVYPVLWLLGSEGTGALGLSQEVALTVLTDLASKVLFSLLVVSWTAGKEVEEGEGERGMGVESGMV